jgi:hypothetical protein
MIWILLFCCIAFTLFFFDNLIVLVGNYLTYSMAAIRNKTVTEVSKTVKRQSLINTILIIICSILWTAFIYLWN